MSTPAQNPRPLAAKTTARMSGFSPAAVTAAARSNHACTGSAFTGGKSITTSATPSRALTSIPIGLPPLRACGEAYRPPVDHDSSVLLGSLEHGSVIAVIGPPDGDHECLTGDDRGGEPPVHRPEPGRVAAAQGVQQRAPG